MFMKNEIRKIIRNEHIKENSKKTCRFRDLWFCFSNGLTKFSKQKENIILRIVTLTHNEISVP
ncbi:CLUMA_CG015569, isoform A [Clunio marinus]|uniref:CLUMA_CG015569, isoform A n=1 Tax=Clunio marinus TaxID=568069 RepID=A0A1J1IP26_9DIPT|nr:CLUMA_CG015569, isoform A [Clunio marinus]